MRVALILMSLFILSGVASAADTAAPAGAVVTTRIATLRLDEAIRNAKLFTSRVDSVNQDGVEVKKALNGMNEQLKQLQNQLSVLSPTNERFPKLQEDAEVLKLKMSILEDRKMGNPNRGTTGEIDRRFTAVIKESYTTVRQLLKEYSKAHGIQIVYILPSGELKARNASDVQMELLMQSVIYADESLDITGDFITYLNAHFAANSSAEAKPAAPAVAPAAPVVAPAAKTEGK